MFKKILLTLVVFSIATQALSMYDFVIPASTISILKRENPALNSILSSATSSISKIDSAISSFHNSLKSHKLSFQNSALAKQSINLFDESSRRIGYGVTSLAAILTGKRPEVSPFDDGLYPKPPATLPLGTNKKQVATVGQSAIAMRTYIPYIVRDLEQFGKEFEKLRKRAGASCSCPSSSNVQYLVDSWLNINARLRDYVKFTSKSWTLVEYFTSSLNRTVISSFKEANAILSLVNSCTNCIVNKIKGGDARVIKIKSVGSYVRHGHSHTRKQKPERSSNSRESIKQEPCKKVLTNFQCSVSSFQSTLQSSFSFINQTLASSLTSFNSFESSTNQNQLNSVHSAIQNFSQIINNNAILNPCCSIFTDMANELIPKFDNDMQTCVQNANNAVSAIPNIVTSSLTAYGNALSQSVTGVDGCVANFCNKTHFCESNATKCINEFKGKIDNSTASINVNGNLTLITIKDNFSAITQSYQQCVDATVKSTQASLNEIQTNSSLSYNNCLNPLSNNNGCTNLNLNLKDIKTLTVKISLCSFQTSSCNFQTTLQNSANAINQTLTTSLATFNSIESSTNQNQLNSVHSAIQNFTQIINSNAILNPCCSIFSDMANELIPKFDNDMQTCAQNANNAVSAISNSAVSSLTTYGNSLSQSITGVDNCLTNSCTKTDSSWICELSANTCVNRLTAEVGALSSTIYTKGNSTLTKIKDNFSVITQSYQQCVDTAVTSTQASLNDIQTNSALAYNNCLNPLSNSCTNLNVNLTLIKTLPVKISLCSFQTSSCNYQTTLFNSANAVNQTLATSLTTFNSIESSTNQNQLNSVHSAIQNFSQTIINNSNLYPCCSIFSNMALDLLPKFDSDMQACVQNADNAVSAISNIATSSLTNYGSSLSQSIVSVDNCLANSCTKTDSSWICELSANTCVNRLTAEVGASASTIYIKGNSTLIKIKDNFSAITQSYQQCVDTAVTSTQASLNDIQINSTMTYPNCLNPLSFDSTALLNEVTSQSNFNQTNFINALNAINITKNQALTQNFQQCVDAINSTQGSLNATQINSTLADCFKLLSIDPNSLVNNLTIPNNLNQSTITNALNIAKDHLNYNLIECPADNRTIFISNLNQFTANLTSLQNATNNSLANPACLIPIQNTTSLFLDAIKTLKPLIYSLSYSNDLLAMKAIQAQIDALNANWTACNSISTVYVPEYNPITHYPMPNLCVTWKPYLNDSGPATDGYYIGNFYDGSAVYVGMGLYPGNNMQPGRLRISSPSGLFLTFIGAVQTLKSDILYLSVSKNCLCTWEEPSFNTSGIIMIGIVLNPGATYNTPFFVTRVNVTNGVTVARLRADNYALYYNEFGGESTPYSPSFKALACNPISNAVQPTELQPIVGAPVKNSLKPNECLMIGYSVTSPSGCFVLSFQTDGNLVLHRKDSSDILWSSNTTNKGGVQACLLASPGNFVVYASGQANFVFNTKTSGANRATVNDDGNFVLYSGTTSIWTSSTTQTVLTC